MTEPGWYDDPTDPRWGRWHDGARWTEYVIWKESWPGPGVPPPPEQQELAPEQQPASTPCVDPATVHGSAAPSAASPITGSPDAAPARAAPVVEPPARAKGGLFGSKKALEEELSALRTLIEGFGYGERTALEAELARLRVERDAVGADLVGLRTELAGLNGQLVRTREEAILQEVGLYTYHHRLEDSVAYREHLDRVRTRIRDMAKKDGGALTAATDWTVNNSKTEGRKMVRDISKLLLRAYNGEADVLVNKLRPYKVEAAVDQLSKARTTISRLGQTMHISITQGYHELRCEELRLTADFLAKKEEEKEAERAEKERLRDEARARKELEAEKARLLKEQAHYASVLARLRASGSPEEVAAAEQQLSALEDAIHGVEEREANVRAGYVYVISNVGAFGPSMVKVGMTRRLDPYDRVRELGDASVPFRYDIHALVFSHDAVGLESRLHRGLADRRVNLVNLRREFFNATPAEVRELLTAADGSVLEFIEEPEADEWHQSENSRRRGEIPVPAAR